MWEGQGRTRALSPLESFCILCVCQLVISVSHSLSIPPFSSSFPSLPFPPFPPSSSLPFSLSLPPTLPLTTFPSFPPPPPSPSLVGCQCVEAFCTQLHCLHSTSHSPVYTPHPTHLSTLHIPLTSLHSTSHSPVYTPHPTHLSTLHIPLTCLHSTSHSPLYTPHPTHLSTLHIPLTSLHSSSHSPVYTPHPTHLSTLHIRLTSPQPLVDVELLNDVLICHHTQLGVGSVERGEDLQDPGLLGGHVVEDLHTA